MLRIDWGTVGRIVKRVCDDDLDPGRLNNLFDIGIDEVSWKRQHYVTLVADQRLLRDGAHLPASSTLRRVLITESAPADLPLLWHRPPSGRLNFGDELSSAIVGRILGREVSLAQPPERKLLAVGSILHFARDSDVIWGAGINGKHLDPSDYHFTTLDVRAVRGPLTRGFLARLGIPAPKLYGDPALLVAYLFDEISVTPHERVIFIPHASQLSVRTPHEVPVVAPTRSWQSVIESIASSSLVVASALHGIVVAESFGVPARFVRAADAEPLFKYADYYLGTGRADFQYARTVSEAIRLGGERPPRVNLQALLDSFPFDEFAAPVSRPG
jgi:pyruvyltransferase